MKKQHVKSLALFVCFAAVIATITTVFAYFTTVANPTTVALSFLIVLILSSMFAGVRVAIATSIVAALCYNYFFLPPIGKWTIADFENWVALFVFLFTAIVISRLTASAHQKAREAESLDTTISRLNEFGTWLLSLPREQITLSGITEVTARIFSLQYCSIHVYTEGKWHHFSGTTIGDTYHQITQSLKFSADHPTSLLELAEENALCVRYAQILRENKPVALLAVKSEHMPSTAIDTIASMIGVLLMEIVSEIPPFILLSERNSVL